jgi:hypothetical protein
MVIAKFPSKLSLPQHNPGTAKVLEYPILKFPAIPGQVWQQRMVDGKVHWHGGSLINAQSPFAAQQRVYYYPELQPSRPDNYSKPLQLLAQKRQFIDLITQQARCFSSKNELCLD